MQLSIGLKLIVGDSKLFIWAILLDITEVRFTFRVFESYCF